MLFFSLGNDVKLIRCVLGIKLNSFIVVHSMFEYIVRCDMVTVSLNHIIIMIIIPTPEVPWCSTDDLIIHGMAIQLLKGVLSRSLGYRIKFSFLQSPFLRQYQIFSIIKDFPKIKRFPTYITFLRILCYPKHTHIYIF